MEPSPSGGPSAPVAAFFDVDNTIIRGASLYQLALALRRRGLITGRDIAGGFIAQLRYLAFGENHGQIAKVRDRALGVIKGHTVAELLAVGEDLYDEVLMHRIFPGTKALLDAHRSAGHQVWLVTATPVEIGRLIAHRIGATGCLGTVAESVDGFYTGRMLGDMMHGRVKAEAVRRLADSEGIDLSVCYAYGDSANDLPMLNEVGNPCAINPDGRLRRYCARHAWPVRDFRGKRRAMRRSVRAASWAGSAWIGALALRAVVANVRRFLGR